MNIARNDLFKPDSEVLSITDLNRLVRRSLEQSLPPLWVRGEISNFTRAASGHWYFSLKDVNAQVRCAMFRHRNQHLDWSPADGAAVEVYALITLYEPKGEYQLAVEQMRHAGLGLLYEAFEKLKRKLEAEGLFEPARKRPLPVFPTRIGIITSPAAAALHDVLSILAKRSPHVAAILYPTSVQGTQAAGEIVSALELASRRNECDVLLLCRGGGSIEDLWPFNEEKLARAIARCAIPVVSGVGHETDFTIADFVADVRAPTPTAAAQLAAPDRAELIERLTQSQGRLRRQVARMLEARMQQVDYLARRLVHPGERIALELKHLAHLNMRLTSSWAHSIAACSARLERATANLVKSRPNVATLIKHCESQGHRLMHSLARCFERRDSELRALEAHLGHLNPLSVLARGYSVVRTRKGEVVRSSAQLAPGDEVRLTLAQGAADATITRTE